MAESIEERRIWDLLVRDFYWRVPSDFLVKVLGRSQATSLGPVRLQVFEIVVAAIFAHLRPEYKWYVTPDLPDGGLDFVGEGRFLEDVELGIAAAITVGGQCKKRSRVTDVVTEISGSLARMSSTINPTFFVVALSARLSPKRISEARSILEATHRRHCHILDRDQIEGLICDHLVVIDPILRRGLSDPETRAVLQYFEKRAPAARQSALDFSVPARVLAGEPFRIPLTLRSSRLASRGMRLWWKPVPVPNCACNDGHSSVILVGPVGADADSGAECVAKSMADDPLTAQMFVELVSYTVGRVDLGEVSIGSQPDVAAGRATTVRLGQVQVVENIRPRFFERPFRAALTKLFLEYDRALARGIACAAIVGSGGSGKSRLCEEFSLEKRRRGCHLVQARQSKTLDDPHRLLRDLLIGLAENGVTIRDPADSVIGAIEKYDRSLASQAAPTIRSIIGMQDGAPATATDQPLVSALLLLIIVRIRSAPLIIHLQDLHWCSADILLLLERLAWQLEIICRSEKSAAGRALSGVLCLFEGRISESNVVGPNRWSTRMFEAFVEKLCCATVSCVPFDPTESLEFVRRLFEDRHSAGRLIDPSLFELQASLAEQIERTAGGNPFHTLAQIQLLKERRILAQNPETGLLYMIQPITDQVMLPETVFESIRLRWQYLRACQPKLATLLWAASRLEDRIPFQLFRHLWRVIGPELSMADIDATEFLWTGNREQAEVSFRHENYFHSLRRLELAAGDRERVAETYARWFSKFRKLDAVDQFRWARILIDSPGPDARKVRSLLGTALATARRRGNHTVACRVLTTLLDFIWTENSRSTITINAFLSFCDQELTIRITRGYRRRG